MNIRFLKDLWSGSSFATWQRVISAILLSIMSVNVGLFSGVVHAKTFEVVLDDFRDSTPEDLEEFALVNVLVEESILNDRSLSDDVQKYCERVQRETGAVCLISAWKGESPARIVESLQQMYFEGVEVSGGIASLVGLVLIGDIPLPVVNNGIDSFPSIFPYTDFVRPSYVYDTDSDRFIRSSEGSPLAEVWHGIIRPPGSDDVERFDFLRQFFDKNARYYSGDDDLTVVDDSIGFQDSFWENDSFDNESKKWYLEKMKSLDRLFNYRYTGEWLNELSGEATDRFAKLTSKTFEGSPWKASPVDVNAEIDFDSLAVEKDAGRLATKALQKNEDIGAYGENRLSNSVPDLYSPGPIRNFLKDYVNVVSRYISGTTEILDAAGRRQSYETMPALITKMDKYYGSLVYLVDQKFEQYLYDQANEMAMDYDMVAEYEKLNDFYTEEATDFLGNIKDQMKEEDLGPLGIVSKAKSNLRGFGSKIYTRFVNGVDISTVQSANDCSLLRGSSLTSEDGESGKVISLNRKDDPLTSQDISGASGRKAKKKIKSIYRSYGYCSYMEKDKCNPSASKRPLFDFASSELVVQDNDFRACFGQDGPPIPKDIEGSSFHSISSIIDHVQPTGAFVQAMLEKKLAHYFPIDAVRHVSFFLGGGSQYADTNVARLQYPNFFEIQSADEHVLKQDILEMVKAKEKDLRRLRVESNWKRFAQYIAYSLPVSGRDDYWNYNEIPDFEKKFSAYRSDVLKILRKKLSPSGEKEDYELIEDYLIGDEVSDETEREIQSVFNSHFSDALAKQSLNLSCDYTFDLPPVSLKLNLPKVDKDDMFVSDLLMDSLIIPDVNPPAISRKCSAKTAKFTVDEVRSLRQFYFSRGGVKVNMAFLHDSDKFIEILDPAALLLYPLDPPAATAVFAEQIVSLKDAPQPITYLSKTVKPVLLQKKGELVGFLSKYESLLNESLSWLNLSIEAKHKKGLSLLSKNKEMLYLVMDGDSENIRFTMPSLKGKFEESDKNVGSGSGVLDEIRDRENSLLRKQEEKRAKRALESRKSGIKQSKCGNSVSLLQWPSAVMCWLDEIVAGPLIESPPGENVESSKFSKVSEDSTLSSRSSGNLILTKTVMTMRDRVEAVLDVPTETEIQWSGEGSIRVEPSRYTKAIVVPEKLGEGTISVKYSLDGVQRSEILNLRVVDMSAVLKVASNSDLRIGDDDELVFSVEIHDSNGDLSSIDTDLRVFAKDLGVFEFPREVQIIGGKGSFSVKSDKKAQMTGIFVGSSTIAGSNVVQINNLAGEPSRIIWKFSDAVFGLDNSIDGEILVFDAFENPYRAEGMRVHLKWDKGMTINGKDGGEGSFFIVAGKSSLNVRLSSDFLEKYDKSPDFAYGYSPGNIENSLPNIPELSIQLVSVDSYPDISLPVPLILDASRDYRIRFQNVPEEVSVGQSFDLNIVVVGTDGSLPLKYKILNVQTEFAGETTNYQASFHGLFARLSLNAPAGSGTLRLIIDDPDFGSQVREISVLGQNAVGIRIVDSSYEGNAIHFVVQGKDSFGNPASLQDFVGKISIIGDGAETIFEKSVVIDDARWVQDIPMSRSIDRIQLNLSVEGLSESSTEVLSHQEKYSSKELSNLNWDTPYMVLVGAGFGNLRSNQSVAQSILFGSSSNVQAITTEIAPHSGHQQVARIWPSGRVDTGPDMKVEAVWQDLKPVFVFSDSGGEVGRIHLNMRDLDFEVHKDSAEPFTWNLSRDRGKVILAPDQAIYRSRDLSSGDLMSSLGEVLVSFEDLQVDVKDPTIQTEIFSDSGDVLVLEFLQKNKTLARLYIHLDLDRVGLEDLSSMYWTYSGSKEDSYDLRSFFAGSSTHGPSGLVLLKKGTFVRYSIGIGRTALDDVREKNGDGFFGKDKMALSFLAGNMVGESTILQSEAIINMGDPVISLRLAKHKLENGEIVPAVSASTQAATSDYSIGQLLYAPEDGEVTQLLRADVEGDKEDDLLVLVKKGDRSILRYLEGQGEGARWGDVSDLLDLGTDVKKVEVVDGKSLLVLYDSGQIVFQRNNDGKYVQHMFDFSAITDETVRIFDFTVRDFDVDGRDDLLFLTGNRELWIWYGSQSLDGIRFGVSDEDRKLLRVMSVRLNDFNKFASTLWLHTKDTSVFDASCREDRLGCKGKYFKAYEGKDSGEKPDKSSKIDRLQLLVDKSQNVTLSAEDEMLQKQSFLVRLDQESAYRDSIRIESTTHKKGDQLNQGDQIDLVYTINPRKSDDDYVLRSLMGSDFTLLGTVDCDGCDDNLRLRKRSGYLWSLEGKMASSRVITIRLSLKYNVLPPYSFQVMEVNGDSIPDIGINVSDNQTGRITLFESRGARDYVETVFGADEESKSSSSDSVSSTLTDLMKGIGLDGQTTDQLKQKLLDKQSTIEATTSGLLDSFHKDSNSDGFPDVYQENPTLSPVVPITSPDKQASNSFDEGYKKDIAFSDSFKKAFQTVKDSLFDGFISQVHAQDKPLALFDISKTDAFSNLDNLSTMIDGIEQDVQSMVRALKCSRGCLPLPLNFAFLAPGPINVFGVPAGFDPGLPVFGVSPVPFFVWPPLVAYQLTQFRIYLSPTLTLGLGVGICFGPYLLGQCFVFSVPLGSVAGSESLCDAIKRGLRGMMRGVRATIGQVTQGLSDAANRTGVIKAGRSGSDVSDAESLLGVSIGGKTHGRGISPEEQKIFLNPIPNLFVDWWDRQWEEIVNSITDLPDITVRLPDFSSSLDPEYFDKLSDKVSGETFVNLQQLYDLINSLPAIRLRPDIVTIQVPWIEPGLLRKMEQSLYEFIYTFLLEFLAFLKSFNLPCNVTLIRQELFQSLRDRAEKIGISDETEKEIERLQQTLDKKDVDLKEAESQLAKFSESKGFAKETVKLRREYFSDMRSRRQKVNSLNKSYKDLEDKIHRLNQPERITEILPVFYDLFSQTMSFWAKQADGFNSASLSNGFERESFEALKACTATSVALDISADVGKFIEGIQKNIVSLQEWKKFPRKLARYLNALEFYMQEVTDLIDQITSIVLKWWSEFEQKLDLWVDVIFSYQEFVALIQMIIDILKGYSKKCGLCSSDRLTLKEIIMKLLFGVVPKFPTISFPAWPDVRLDFSDVQLGINVTMPVFEVKTVDLRWPKLPDITFPRFQDITGPNIDFGLRSKLSISLPEIPLVVPPPPELPPLAPIPDLPQINLPNLPPAPEVPQILEALLPVMKIIQTVLDLWCLVNKSLIPFDEKQLKTQIENLTNRSNNLILPIDIMLTLDLFPGDLLKSFAPFDTIDVTSHFKANVDVNPFGDLQKTVDESFNMPMSRFTRQIDLWINTLKDNTQQGAGALSKSLGDRLGKFDVRGTDADLNINAGAGAGVNAKVPLDLLNYTPALAPDLSSDLFAKKRNSLIASNVAFKKGLKDVMSSLHSLNSQKPDMLLSKISSLSSDDVLVAGEPTFLKARISQERQKSLYDPNNFTEKRISLIDKDALIAQITKKGNDLKAIQNEMLDTSTSKSNVLAVSVVRDGEAGRLQDYPLSDPVVSVWDNDVILAYENSVYVKSSDNSYRKHTPYTGNVLRSPIDRFQRSKVHRLTTVPVSDSANANGNATLRWEWESPGVQDVELTIWDSVGMAQRLDQEHIRYYLSKKEENISSFEVLTSGIDLQEGKSFVVNTDIRLRFGMDQVLLPSGVVFTIPSLDRRALQLDGTGLVTIENYSGASWDLVLGDSVRAEMIGKFTMTFPSSQELSSPEVEARPYIRRISGVAEGALRPRVEIVPGEVIPAGIFMALRDSRLEDSVSGAVITINTGFTFEVSSNDSWVLSSGSADVVLGDDLMFTQAKEGMVLLDNELVRGDFVVRYKNTDIDVSKEEQVMWSSIDSSFFDVTLPEGNYYGRIRGTEGLRGYSPIVYGSARPLYPKAQVVSGVETLSVPIYTSFTIDARDYVVGDLPDESYSWQLGDDQNFTTGRVYRYSGFDDIGKYDIHLYIRNGTSDFKTKDFVVNVFIPDLRIDDVLYNESRIIRIQSDPPVPNIPIGIVGERDSNQDWLLSTTTQGSRLDNRYYTDEKGVVQLVALDKSVGMNVIVKGGLNIARLYPNGRVVLHDEFSDQCQNEAIYDTDGYLKYRVSCLFDGKLIEQFKSRMVPHLDTDVTIVEDFSDTDVGVVIRSLQSSLELIPLGRGLKFAAGGAQLRRRDGNVLMLISPDGQVELLKDTLSISVKEYTDPSEPVVWQLFQNSAILAEFQVKGPGDVVNIIDPVDRVDLLGDADKDGLPDQWERSYGLDDASADPDLDGLTNLEEFTLATNPLMSDTDSDGLLDGEEVDPLSASSTLKKVKFSDLQKSDPYFEAISELAKLGFVQGYDDGTFRPDQPVTRAEAIKILMSIVRCESCSSPTKETRDAFDPTLKDFDYFVQFHDGVFNNASDDPIKNFPFSSEEVRNRDDVIRSYFDVSKSDWFYYCVETATDLGLIQGYRGIEDGVNALGNFIPGRNVNIAELMKMVIEAVGENGKSSDKEYGVSYGWWNDPKNNYIAKAEEDMNLLLNSDDYAHPQRKATRAEVAYAAFQVLRKNGVLDFDNDGISNQSDACPCQASGKVTSDISNGCPDVFEPRRPERLFEGIEIVQGLDCNCLAVVDADLFVGSRFFSVITGKNNEDVLAKSNEVGG